MPQSCRYRHIQFSMVVGSLIIVTLMLASLGLAYRDLATLGGPAEGKVES